MRQHKVPGTQAADGIPSDLRTHDVTGSLSDPPGNYPAQLAEFLHWCWTFLGWEIECRSDGSCWLHVPENVQPQLNGAAILPVPSWPRESPPEPTDDALSEPLLAVTVQALSERGEAIHAAPACQPTSVHELTPQLFGVYTVEGGRVRLGGCTWEDHPLVRITYQICSATDGRPRELRHYFTTGDGRAVAEGLVDSLRVHPLIVLERPPRPLPSELAAWLPTARRWPLETGEGYQAAPLLATLVWCKRFCCKLIFEISDARADVSFSSWAQWLVDGSISPPPFRCPRTGRESYHVVRTDDGQITVPEAVAVCEHSGRRVLETDLEVCQATGRRVLTEFLRTCPVTGQRVLADDLVACAVCGQQVSPAAVSGDICQACRSLWPVRRADPRMARVLGEHPTLEQWSKWRMAETETVYILRGSSFFRRLLVVLDKESLDPLRLADSSVIARGWSSIAQEQWGEYLG